ncbi:metallophosphoesterase family protein [Azospirillum aestuarii]|uniref:metallophosphoesterase family protein n=1 Tax=Azospirillum aestuarii TaxID=2802052 RepID=UPI004054C2C0
MEAPVIVLRFRDTTPGVDTIAEHLNLLSRHGAVWWGWWRKEREQATAQDVPDGPLRIILTDRSTRRMFSADCECFTARGAEVDPKDVPEYYRHRVGEIEGFFRLTRLDETHYDHSLADRLGERTMIRLGEPGVGPAEHLAGVATAAGRSSVLHLSDLHFGADYGYLIQGEQAQIGDGRRTLTDCIVADLERIGLRNDIAAVIVTGDFITRGDWNDRVRNAALKEFEALRSALRLTKQQVVAVPGNHDIVRYADGLDVDISALAVSSQTNQQHEREFRTFVDELIDRNWKESLNYIRQVSLGAVDLQICVLNSCTITGTKWREYGYVGTSGIDTIRTMGRMRIERPTFRFIALHHHLLPVAAVEAPASQGVTLALDASMILTEAQDAGVHVVLHGHQHKAKLSTYMNLPLAGAARGNPIHVVSNGSAGVTSKRLPDGENNTYCLFTVVEERLHLRVRELRTNAQLGAQMFDQGLDSKAAVPSNAM